MKLQHSATSLPPLVRAASLSGTCRNRRAYRVSLHALLSGSALLLAASPAIAQSAPSDAADTVVVTGAATPIAHEKLGYALSVISGERIEDQGYSYAPDALRQVAGLSVNRGGAFGAVTQVRIRGAEGNHTLVLVDGIDVSSPDQGETDFSTLLSGDIARIEILRGPQSGLYGSNALAGVVNLITNRTIDGRYVNASVEAGAFNTFQLQASAGLGNGADYASAGFHMLTTDGYDVSPEQSAAGVPAVGVRGKAGDKEGDRIATVYLRGGRTLSPALRVDGIARYLNKRSELDGQAFSAPIPGRAYDDASTVSNRQALFGASATLNLLDDRWTTVLSASHLDERRRDETTSFPFVTGPAAPTPGQLAAVTLDPSGADSTRTKVALQSTWRFGGPAFTNFVTGFAESKRETYQNPCPGFCAPEQRPQQSRNLASLGLQYRAEIAQQLYLSATARHDDNDDFEDADTWSIAASWVIPRTGLRPHASFGTGVTNPTFFEQFGFDPGTFVGNPDLLPEHAKGWDIGLEQTLFGGRLVADLTWFESQLKNEIFVAFGPPPNFLSTPDNRVDKSERSGLELSLRLAPTDTIDLVASYTHLDASEPAGIEVRRPEQQGAIDASWRPGASGTRAGRLQLNLGLTYNGEQVDTDFGTFLLTGMDAYTLLRLGASWQVSDTIEIYGRIENATDADYEEIIGHRGAPQGVFVGMRLKDRRSD